jgi:hypothetical protein
MQSPVQLPVQSTLGRCEQVGSQLTSSWLAHVSWNDTGVHFTVQGLLTSTVQFAFASMSMLPHASMPACAGRTKATAKSAQARAAKRRGRIMEASSE